MPSESSSESYEWNDEEIVAAIRREQIKAYSQSAVLEQLTKDSAKAIDELVKDQLFGSAKAWSSPHACECSHQDWNHDPEGRCIHQDCNCQQFQKRAA